MRTNKSTKPTSFRIGTTFTAADGTHFEVLDIWSLKGQRFVNVADSKQGRERCFTRPEFIAIYAGRQH